MGRILYYGTGMSKENEKHFHGPFYTDMQWTSTTHMCCKLCKTQHSEGRHKHWAKGLCRSCYRRLSVTHRLYNDSWNKPEGTAKVGKKKSYKQKDPKDIVFDELDIATLLDRYNWKCAYSGTKLQGHDHRKADAFQLEYMTLEDGKITLVPVCRAVNCSKKGLNDSEQLRKWAESRGLDYPFKIVTVDGLLQK